MRHGTPAADFFEVGGDLVLDQIEWQLSRLFPAPRADHMHAEAGLDRFTVQFPLTQAKQRLFEFRHSLASRDPAEIAALLL